MMTHKKLVYVIGAVSLLSLVLGFVAVNRDVVQQVVDNTKYGSIVGPDVPEGRWNYNGFQEIFRSQAFLTGTSTLCAIAIPKATSTLVAFYANFAMTDTTAGTFYIATSTTPYATTSPLFSGSIGASSTTTIAWLATTTDTTAQNKILPIKGGYIVFDVKGKTSWNYGGKCYAEFRAFE
jgi:hypothetical protein